MILIVFLIWLSFFGQGHQEYSDDSEDELDSLFQPSILSAVIVLADNKKPPKKENTTKVETIIIKRSPQDPFNNCEEALAETFTDAIGVYPIKITTSKNLATVNVTCEPDPGDGPAWIRIHHHSEDGAIDFDGGWSKYRKGFGLPAGDFFLGLTYIHVLTHSEPHELWIQLENSEGHQFHAHYNLFAIGDENQDFPLLVLGAHSGNISDALRNNVGQKFSTSDRDNDSDTKKNCAKEFLGGWWFYNSSTSDDFCNLNGNFIESQSESTGIRWDQGEIKAVFKKSSMSIRPVSANLN